MRTSSHTGFAVRFGLALAVLALVATGCVKPPSTPAHVRDQQSTEMVPALVAGVYAHPDGYSDWAQTFTAGTTGALDQVSFAVTPYGGSPRPLVIQVQGVDGSGQPNGIVLGSGTYSGAGSATELTGIPLTTTANVTAGSSYALVAMVFDHGGEGGWELRSGIYGSGTTYARSGFASGAWTLVGVNSYFETWVVPA